MIVHIADAASPALDEQIEAVRRVLEEIGAANMPEVLVLNKIDLVPGSRPSAPREPVSRARSPCRRVTGEGADGLLAAIAETVPTPPVEVHALIPWDRGDLVAMLYREAEVLSADAEPDGTRVHARVGLRELAAVRAFTTAVVRRRRLALGAGVGDADRPERRVVPLARDHRVGVLPALGANRSARSCSRTVSGICASSGGSGGRLVEPADADALGRGGGRDRLDQAVVVAVA